MISILPIQCDIFNIQIRGLISYRKSDIISEVGYTYRRSDIISEVGYHIGSRIYISEVGYTYRKSDIHIGSRISYWRSDIHIGGQIYISEVGYIYRRSDIYIGGRIYISEL